MYFAMFPRTWSWIIFSLCWMGIFYLWDRSRTSSDVLAVKGPLHPPPRSPQQSFLSVGGNKWGQGALSKPVKDPNDLPANKFTEKEALRLEDVVFGSDAGGFKPKKQCEIPVELLWTNAVDGGIYTSPLIQQLGVDPPSSAMLCYVMLCHAQGVSEQSCPPCSAMLCYAMLCYAMLC
eukprot:g51367.t1